MRQLSHNLGRKLRSSTITYTSAKSTIERGRAIPPVAGDLATAQETPGRHWRERHDTANPWQMMWTMCRMVATARDVLPGNDEGADSD